MNSLHRCRVIPHALVHRAQCNFTGCMAMATVMRSFHPMQNRTLPSSPSHTHLAPHRRHGNPLIHFSTTFTKSEYIHPLSQIVLEHLQSHHRQWVTRMGLDTGLKLNTDGTFALRFPPAPGSDGTIVANSVVDAKDDRSHGVTSGSIW